MAKEVGVSRHKIWKRNDLKPHRTRTFKLSKDPTSRNGCHRSLPPSSRERSCSAVTRKPCQALEQSAGIALRNRHIRIRTRHGTIELPGRQADLPDNSGTPMWSGCVSSSRSNGKHPSRCSPHCHTVLISMNVSAVGSTVIHALHADRELLAESCRTLLRRSHQRCDSRRQLSQRPRTGSRHRILSGRPQRGSSTLHMAYKRRSNPRQDSTSQRGSGQR